MSIFRDFFVKEKPVFTGITRGLGGFGFGASFGAAAEPATPFTAKMVLVGGGGGGSPTQGGGGGGAGGVAFFDYAITLNTSYPVRVGSGGRGANPSNDPGLDGEYSQWTASSDYLVGEGGNGGAPTTNGGNGNFQAGSGAGGGTSGVGGNGVAVPAPLQPYIFGGNNGGTGHPGSGADGGNQGGGGGGATEAGATAGGPGTPGTVGGGGGGNGKEVPTAYLPDTFTQTDTGPQPGQFLGMLISQPAALRRTFGGGGGGGSEHGAYNIGTGGGGGGGHGGWGSPPTPASGNTNYPPAGPAGQVIGPNTHSVFGEAGYRGRGGGGGGGGYTPGEGDGGPGGAGVLIIQSPTAASITVGSIPSPNVNTYTSGGKKYHVILGNQGTPSATGTVLSGTVTFS